MSKLRWVAVVGVVAVAILATGCSCCPFFGQSAEEKILAAMAQYRAAFEAEDSEGVMAVIADDYVGLGDSDKAAVGDFVDNMEEYGVTIEFNLDEAVVAVDGDEASVTGVAVTFGDRTGPVEYQFKKTDAGWLMSGVTVDEGEWEE